MELHEIYQIIDKFKDKYYQDQQAPNWSINREQYVAKKSRQKINGQFDYYDNEMMEQAIEIFKYLIRVIQDITSHNDILKQDVQNLKQLRIDDHQEIQNTAQDLKIKIEQLKKEIINRDDRIREMSQQLEHSEEQQQLGSAKINEIEQLSAVEIQQLKGNFKKNNEIISTLREQILGLEEINQQYRDENYFLKEMNSQLLQNIEMLQSQTTDKKQKQIKSSQKKVENQVGSWEQNCSLQSIERAESEHNLTEKQYLNLSRLSSKLNFTRQIELKDHNQKSVSIDVSVNLPTNNDQINQRSPIEVKNSIQSDNFIAVSSKNPQQFFVDPYYAFFLLLIQSQKLNSPYFETLVDVDITYLYRLLLDKSIPFNQWQKLIKKELIPNRNSSQ